jgi:polar amino acid transport system substrate-binding protein
VSWVADGKLRGLAPTLVRDLFAELGLNVRLEAFGNWKRCLQEVREGRADIVVAAYRNRERERHFAFSAHHLVVDPIVLFVRRDRRFVFDDWEDLRGRSVGLLLGDSFGERFDRFAETALRVERVSTGRQNMRKLVLGRIDFMPIGRESGRLQRRQLGYEDVVEALPQPLVTEYYHVAVRKGSELEALLPEIDLRLTALHAEGGIARALQAHAERYLAEPPEADAGDEKLD